MDSNNKEYFVNSRSSSYPANPLHDALGFCDSSSSLEGSCCKTYSSCKPDLFLSENKKSCCPYQINNNGVADSWGNYCKNTELSNKVSKKTGKPYLAFTDGIYEKMCL